MNHETRLPYGKLKTEIHFACEAAIWAELEASLRAAAPNEACVFALARPSRGLTRTTIILRELIWPKTGEVVATPHSLELSADYISRVMDAAIDAGELVGAVLIHTHPHTAEFGRGWGRFSRRDDWYEARLFPTITLGRSQAISGSIVIGSEPNDCDARAWWNDGTIAQVQPAQVIRVVGPEVKFLELPRSGWTDHPDPAVMDRSTRLWGAQGRRRLQNIRVGIVGVGGTGSIALLSLATMGVGKIRAWDKDPLQKENLHRTLGATKQMVGYPKVEVLAEVARAVATASPFDLAPFAAWGTSPEALQSLKDCDLIFCCVDKLAPRVPLNDLAYAHLIPTFDVGSWLHQSKGVVDAIVTHAHAWTPGIPCAWCRQTLTPLRLMREAQGKQRDIENIVPYGLTLAQTDGVEPSVLPLNLTGVGLALMEFMQVALKITDRTPRDLKLFLPEWELDESDLLTQADCATEASSSFGDTIRIRPV